MSDRTSIEWTDATWNPVRGCARVSEGCRHCYAETVAARFGADGQPYAGLARYVTRPDGSREARWTGEATFGHNLDQPLRWRRPRRIFVNSMSDLFYERFGTGEIATVLAVMIAAHHLRGHTFQVLTKRPSRMRRLLGEPIFWDQVNAEAGVHVMDGTDPLVRRSDDARATLDDYGPENPPPGIWLGVSVEDQATANERIPILLDTPAALRWISAEPLLGAVDLRQLRITGEPHSQTHEALSGVSSDTPWGYVRSGVRDPLSRGRIDWVVAGGESGPGARPMHPDWVRSLRDQCDAAGVPFLLKQWGEHAPGSDLRYDARTFCMDRSGRTVPAPARAADFPAGSTSADGWAWMRRVGKKAAGRQLDGKIHDEFPEASR